LRARDNEPYTPEGRRIGAPKQAARGVRRAAEDENRRRATPFAASLSRHKSAQFMRYRIGQV
jgi:hypothetical protein